MDGYLYMQANEPFLVYNEWLCLCKLMSVDRI
jgi:hypothetical protein